MRIDKNLWWPAFLLVSVIHQASVADAALISISHPANILPGAGRTVMTSKVGFTGFLTASAVIDNQVENGPGDGSFIFGDSPANTAGTLNSLAIRGFNGGIGTIRIYALNEPKRIPSSITVRSSTSLITDLTASNYETLLGTFALNPTTIGSTLTPYPSAPANRGYFDLHLTTPAPAGTQSLFLEFTVSAANGGVRVYEIQALPVPEPSSVVLIGGAVLFLPAIRRSRQRRRRQ